MFLKQSKKSLDYLRVSWYYSKFLIFKLLKVKKASNSYYKVKLFPNYNDLTFKFCYVGLYGNSYSNFLLNIKSDHIFIDIGANQGLYSLIAAKNPNTLKIFSFEPVENVFKILKNNIEINNFKNIEPIPFAISNSEGIAKINTYKNHTGKSTLTNNRAEKHHSTTRIITKDFKYFNKDVFKNSPLHVKIDVEGHEFIVIKELLKSKIFKNIMSIYVEININWTEFNSIKKILIKENFKTFIKIGNSDVNFDVLCLRV